MGSGGKLLNGLKIGFFELFIGFFMVIGLIGYFFHLPADLEWIDHTVAFAMFGYFFYALDITSVIFGHSSKKTNLVIILAFFSLFFKDIIAYTSRGAFEFLYLGFLNNAYEIIDRNIFDVTIASFYIGLFGMLIAAAIVSKKSIGKPSLADAVFGRINSAVLRFFACFLLLLGFYYLVFNPLLEWLEFVLDDPIVLFGIIYFSAKAIGHVMKFEPKHAISRIGDIVWGWYRKFISLFHSRKTLFLAISGLLLLHLVADIGVFAYSLIFGKESFYSSFLNSGSESFFGFFMYDTQNYGKAASFAVLYAYLFNAISLLSFLLIPVFAWSRLFFGKPLSHLKAYLFLAFSSISMHLMVPAYSITQISSENVAGINISPISVIESSSFLDAMFPEKIALIASAAAASFLFGCLIYWICGFDRARKEITAIAIIAGLVFYASYLFAFYSSLASYIIDSAAGLFFLGHYAVSASLFLYLLFAAILYILGFFMLAYEIVMEYHRKKWSESIDNEAFEAIVRARRIEKSFFSKKSQLQQEIFKYGIVVVFSVVAILAGYKSVSSIRDKSCQAEILTFQSELENIDRYVRFGTKEQKSLRMPCNADSVYFFDLEKKPESEMFSNVPIMKDAIESGSANNVFIVKGNNVKKSFYAGKVKAKYPYHLCLKDKFGKISFFTEGVGEGVEFTSACDQPECTLIPSEISEEDAKAIISEAAYSPDGEVTCEKCINDYDADNLRLSKEKVEMFRRFSSCGGVTAIEIVLRPKEKVKDFRYYEFIPKECIDDLEGYLEGNIGLKERIIVQKNDPMIVWEFGSLDEETTIKYRLKDIEEECVEIIKGISSLKGEGLEFEDEAAQRPCANTDESCGFSGNCANCASLGQVCQNRACFVPEGIDLKLPRVYFSPDNISSNVFGNLREHTFYDGRKQAISYSVSQADEKFSKCEIYEKKHASCRFVAPYGYSEVTITATDGRISDSETFIISKSPASSFDAGQDSQNEDNEGERDESANSNEQCETNCVPNQKSCHDSSSEITCIDFDGDGCYSWSTPTYCGAGMTCIANGCSLPCQPHSGKKCGVLLDRDKIFWEDSCANLEEVYYDCRDNSRLGPDKNNCNGGKCCYKVGNRFWGCEEPYSE